MSIENHFSLLMKRTLLFLTLAFCSFITNAQVVNFDQLNTAGSGKAINWTTSIFGSGFGHRWISADPGEFTTLNLQYRHNSSTWNDAMVITTLGNIGIGTTTPTQKLEVNGTIRTKEVKVEATTWPDYVFKNKYQLMPLSELEFFIQTNGHLPDIPIESEVLKNGFNLSEMNIKLLEKVEELTLYLIEQQKQINLLKDELNLSKGKN